MELLSYVNTVVFDEMFSWRVGCCLQKYSLTRTCPSCVGYGLNGTYPYKHKYSLKSVSVFFMVRGTDSKLTVHVERHRTAYWLGNIVIGSVTRQHPMQMTPLQSIQVQHILHPLLRQVHHVALEDSLPVTPRDVGQRRSFEGTRGKKINRLSFHKLSSQL